jgi:hypothetical protein
MSKFIARAYLDHLDSIETGQPIKPTPHLINPPKYDPNDDSNPFIYGSRLADRCPDGAHMGTAGHFAGTLRRGLRSPHG